jgi:hypothetical protein
MVYGLKLSSDPFVDLIVDDPGRAWPELETDDPPLFGLMFGRATDESLER